MALYSYDTYEIHGLGFETLWTGLEAIGMPQHRWQAAVDAVRAILAAEGATGFCWYKVPTTDELAPYWNGCHRNELWIEPGNVHVNPEIKFPLPVTAFKNKREPMHHLPGAVRGAGGRRTTSSPGIPLPCQVCMNPHAPDEDCY